jgi:tRNA(adenine34) deaminase
MLEQESIEARDERFMHEALQLAEQGAALGEVPVGAVLVQDGEIIGRGFNSPISLNDPSAHAEVQAIRDAAMHLHNYRLPDTTLYVTLEPCHMCAGLIVHARIARVVFAANEPRAGAVESQGCFFSQSFLNHRVEIRGGVLAQESAQMLKAFFKARRVTKTTAL